MFVSRKEFLDFKDQVAKQFCDCCNDTSSTCPCSGVANTTIIGNNLVVTYHNGNVVSTPLPTSNGIVGKVVKDFYFDACGIQLTYSDNTSNYLPLPDCTVIPLNVSSVVVSGSSLIVTESNGNVTTYSLPTGTGSDELIKINSSDTTAGYLFDKLDVDIDNANNDIYWSVVPSSGLNNKKLVLNLPKGTWEELNLQQSNIRIIADISTNGGASFVSYDFTADSVPAILIPRFIIGATQAKYHYDLYNRKMRFQAATTISIIPNVEIRSMIIKYTNLNQIKINAIDLGTSQFYSPTTKTNSIYSYSNISKVEYNITEGTNCSAQLPYPFAGSLSQSSFLLVSTVNDYEIL